MKDVFLLNENSFYNTRNKRTFHSRHIRTVHFGSETLSRLASKIWELVPEKIKKSTTDCKNVVPMVRTGFSDKKKFKSMCSYINLRKSRKI